jgi:catalase
MRRIAAAALRAVRWTAWRVFWVLAVFFVASASYLVWQFFLSAPPRGPVGEQVSPNEEFRVSQLIADGENLISQTRAAQGDGIYRRDAHAKTQGCAVGSFRVGQSYDSRIRYGLFSKPGEYKAWIRFSNGAFRIQPDWKPDGRGMAVKVLGVPGTKILDREENATTQDFLLINYPVFFLSSADEYVKLTALQEQGDDLGYFFGHENPAPYSGGRFNARNWHLRELRLGLGVLGVFPPHLPPASVLATRYYSMTPYQLGPSAYVKYSAKPVRCASGGEASGWAGFGGSSLHDDLKQQLRAGTRFCFDFMVQFQYPGKYMPVEDPTIEWKEKDSPFISVAKIEIGRQDIDQAMKNDFCENLSFSPWHSLPEHTPVGGINRVRKAVYQHISRYRRCNNGKYFGEPSDDGKMAFTTERCDPNKEVPEVKPGS